LLLLLLLFLCGHFLLRILPVVALVLLIGEVEEEGGGGHVHVGVTAPSPDAASCYGGFAAAELTLQEHHGARLEQRLQAQLQCFKVRIVEELIHKVVIYA